MAASYSTEAPGQYTPRRSRWSPWLWLLVILGTFLVADSTVGTGAAWSCSAAMLVSAMLQRAIGSPFRASRITIGSFWFISYLVMIFFPAFLVYSDERDPFRGPFLFAVTSVLITVPLGFIVASQFSKFRQCETEMYFRKPLEGTPNPAGTLPRLSVLLGIALILIVVYLRDVSVIPVFYLLRHPGETVMLSILREDSFKLLNSPLEYVFFMTRGLLFPFLILVSFGYFRRTRERRWLLTFLLALLSGIFFASLSLVKAPVAGIFVMLALFVYYRRHGSFSYKFVIAATLLIFAFPLFVIFGVSERGTTLMVVLQAIATRLAYVPADTAYLYFEFFPSHLAFLHGRSIHALSVLLGLNFVDTSNTIAHYALPNGLASASYNAAFFSDMYADFGMAGVLIGGVAAGIIMQAFHIYLVRRPKTVCNLATYCFLIYMFWFLHSVPLQVVLASDGTLASLALLWFFDGKAWPHWFSRNVRPPLFGESFLRIGERRN